MKSGLETKEEEWRLFVGTCKLSFCCGEVFFSGCGRFPERATPLLRLPAAVIIVKGPKKKARLLLFVHESGYSVLLEHELRLN